MHLDKDGAARNWQRLAPPKIEKPDAQVWRQLIDDFWFGTHNLAKYLARGDLWTAKWLDAEIKNYILKLLEWHGVARGADVWHLGHHLQSWTDTATFTEVETLFARFDAADSRRAMRATCDLFGRLAREVSAIWELQYPDEVERGVRVLMEKMEN
ncbi:Streptomycin adenylyltransferase [Abditibacterium utsteinense]|uniref:Streptomycin adenylyltransferase n=1 Tax=Abditibacterium utsteinense TaxID=1960156 RepID=A0A2S8SUM0_9BACT|nr:Streptomycin adenylyltransferase [Abditibacterium utsteinense]